MARTFTTQEILDVHIEQIMITRTKDTDGNPQIRVRSSVIVTMVDSLDPTRTTVMNLQLNKTIQELSVGPAVATIRNAVLQSLKSQIA